jgi:hypothetical protein
LDNEACRFGYSSFPLLGFAQLPLGRAQEAKGTPLPEGQGKAALQRICSGCHPPGIVARRHETKERWAQIVTDMVNKGANGSDDEFNDVIEYLAAHFGVEKRK